MQQLQPNERVTCSNGMQHSIRRRNVDYPIDLQITGVSAQAFVFSKDTLDV